MNTKTEKIATLFALLIVVIGCVALLIWLVRPLIIQENAYRKMEGTIVNLGKVRWNYFRAILDTGENIFWLNNYQSSILKDKEIIVGWQEFVGKEATIWYLRRASGYGFDRKAYIAMRKMVVNDEVIIPFRKPIGTNGFFIGLVLIILFFTLRELFKKRKKL